MTKATPKYSLEKLRLLRQAQEKETYRLWESAQEHTRQCQSIYQDTREESEKVESKRHALEEQMVQHSSAQDLQESALFIQKLLRRSQTLSEQIAKLAERLKWAKKEETEAQLVWQAARRDREASDKHFEKWQKERKRDLSHRQELGQEEHNDSHRAFQSRNDNKGK
ncbi:MAG: hypothetical protein IPJ88_05335 [Myxococcales bacterium]|nr:MAG: hypothetical protein IPJ88_05335 [Myxococcales bacterium]